MIDNKCSHPRELLLLATDHVKELLGVGVCASPRMLVYYSEGRSAFDEGVLQFRSKPVNLRLLPRVDITHNTLHLQVRLENVVVENRFYYGRPEGIRAFPHISPALCQSLSPVARGEKGANHSSKLV